MSEIMTFIDGIPVVSAQWNAHRIGDRSCRFDNVHDPHIHLDVDYSSESIVLQAFGPGVPFPREYLDAWDDPARWTHRAVPAVPRWWHILLGRTLGRELERMAARIARCAARHRLAADVLDKLR